MSRQKTLAAVGLGLIVLLGAFVRFHHLGTYHVGNAYYVATVQSMLRSRHNLFYASFEPGGSATIDKPPLGLWVQTASAYVFGTNGFALALPQALAGVLSIPLLYTMVKRQFSTLAGLTAALALAVMPIMVAVERSNRVGGLLPFVLLLATSALLRAVRSGRCRYLLLEVILVGLGFNIKMLQAFMPLPALYAVYLLGARHRWRKRLAHLVVATVVLIGISLSWAIAVDLTPADERPYITSSGNNTVMGLIIGHNALTRLGLSPGQRLGTPSSPRDTASHQLPQGPPQPGVHRLYQEVGRPGLRRLFVPPLVTEASWLLSFVLLGILLILIKLGWQWPLSDGGLALVLWGGWLLPELVYFTFNTGLFHAHYLIMLGPPLAALTGATTWAIFQTQQEHRWLGWGLLALLSGGTIAFQVITLQHHPGYAMWAVPTSAALVTKGWELAAQSLVDAWWVVVVCTGLLALSLGTLAFAKEHSQRWVSTGAFSVAMIAIMVVPSLWSALTTFNTNPDACLPRSGRHTYHTNCPSGLPRGEQWLAEYLVANTEPEDYLVATLTAYEAALFVLATERPVLALGGFTGNDNIVDVDKLSQMVQEGRLRFVLDQDLARRKPAIAAWLRAHCRRQAGRLYDCSSR